MSSIICNESSHIGIATCDRRIVVDLEEAKNLADYVKTVRHDKGWSLSDVEKNSERAGFKIAGSYVSRIENGIVSEGGVTPKKLQALAAGLEVPVMALFYVALGKQPPSNLLERESQRLVNLFAELPRECQLDVLALTEALWHRRRTRKVSPLKDEARRTQRPKEMPDPKRRVG